MAKKYANIELLIKSQSTLSLGNSANYQSMANWNGTQYGNVTSVGSNGNPSPYGLYDTMGQLYEWTESKDPSHPQLKYIRGGSYVDPDPLDLIAIKKFLYNNMLEQGCFGFRIASYDNPLELNNFVTVTGNNSYDNNIYNRNTCNNTVVYNNLTIVDPRSELNLGLVNNNYMISKYLVTNAEYCEYLNIVDANGTNKEIFDYRMDLSPIGGIHLKQSFENPTSNNHYIVKSNMGNKPVAFITWTMAAKYCNWLHHDKTSTYTLINNGVYNLNQISSNRSISGNYFLPTNNEWHKAALYDPVNDTYLKFSTSHETPPKPIICNNTGEAYNIVGYFEPSIKTFPIIITKDIEEITITPNVFSANINYTTTPSDFQNNIYFISTNINGAVSGETYRYTYSSSSGTNWPAHISPITGIFIADSDGSYTINNILRFCPLSRYTYTNASVCANLGYDLDSKLIENTWEQGTGVLSLQVNISGINNHLAINNYATITGTNLPILPKNNIVDISFLTVSGNNILTSGLACDQYVPVVAIAKPGTTHTKAGEIYNYIFSASDTRATIVPTSGTFGLHNTATAITTMVKLNGAENTALNITISQPNTDFVNVDYVNIICLDKCEP